MPVGWSMFAGWPCSCPASSAAAATSTTPRSDGVVDGRLDGLALRGARIVPKLMLMACAPWSVASTIDREMLVSEKSVRSRMILQPKPVPARPMPLSVAAQACDATCVPCPSGSRAPAPAPWSTTRMILPAKSGCRPSMPVSTMPTFEPIALGDVPGARQALAGDRPLDRGPRGQAGVAQRVAHRVGQGRVVGQVAGTGALLGTGREHGRVLADARRELARRLPAARAKGHDPQLGHRCRPRRSRAGGNRLDRGCARAGGAGRLGEHHHHAAGGRRRGGAGRKGGEREGQRQEGGDGEATHRP